MMCISIKTPFHGWRDVSVVRAMTALSEVSSLVPSTHTGCLKTASNSSSWESEAVF